MDQKKPQKNQYTIKDRLWQVFLFTGVTAISAITTEFIINYKTIRNQPIEQVVDPIQEQLQKEAEELIRKQQQERRKEKNSSYNEGPALT